MRILLSIGVCGGVVCVVAVLVCVCFRTALTVWWDEERPDSNCVWGSSDRVWTL